MKQLSATWTTYLTLQVGFWGQIGAFLWRIMESLCVYLVDGPLRWRGETSLL